ncbi:MAG: RIP metalloprotease RseP [Clostridiales bacterium]|nr:RIP metalloprotease RseP [Clostridiales bacterium]
MAIKFVVVIFVLGIIVVIHEFGHFMSARSIGIAVQEFAIGVGPALWKKQGKNALYSIRCLPFGGYCLFDPLLEGFDQRGRPLSITNRKALSKIYVSISGPILNFVLAAVFFTLLFSVVGITVGYEAVIGEVYQDTPASEAGLLPGDRILSIEGEELASWADLSRILAQHGEGGALGFEVQREGASVPIKVMPRYSQNDGRVMIGVVVDRSRAVVKRLSLWEGITLGFGETASVISGLLSAISQMATGKISVSENLSGPVALVQLIGETASDGLSDTLFLTAFLSVNLGVMNLLPFPALDGGRIIVYLVELLRRKPASEKVEGWIHAAGLAVLLCLMAFLTFQDIARIFGGS